MKKSKQQMMADNITKHGRNLQRIFNVDMDPVVLCKKLRRLEMEAHRITTDMCNREVPDGETQLERILAKVDAILRFSKQGIPVFINQDARGYALKIRSEYVRDHTLDIYRDWGGYGIIAPDYSE